MTQDRTVTAVTRRIHGHGGARRAVAALTEGLTRGGAALVVTGEHGLGRTALLEWAARRFEAGSVVRVRGVPGRSGVPYAGLSVLICAVADLGGGRRTGGAGRGPGGRVGRGGVEGHAEGDGAGGPAAVDGLDEAGAGGVAGPGSGVLVAEEGRAAARTDLPAVLRRAAEDAPLLVCVDDVHLWDAPSRAVLGAVAAHAHTVGRVGLLLSFAGHLAADPYLARCPSVGLSPLAPSEAAALLDEVTEPSVDRSLREALLDEAEGSPALLLALASRWSRAGASGRRAPARPSADAEMLAGLAGRQPLAGLPPRVRDLALVAAAALRETDDTEVDAELVRKAAERMSAEASPRPVEASPDCDGRAPAWAETSGGCASGAAGCVRPSSQRAGGLAGFGLALSGWVGTGAGLAGTSVGCEVTSLGPAGASSGCAVGLSGSGLVLPDLVGISVGLAGASPGCDVPPQGPAVGSSGGAGAWPGCALALPGLAAMPANCDVTRPGGAVIPQGCAATPPGCAALPPDPVPVSDVLVLADGRFRFAGTLIRRAVYTGAGADRCRAAHRALAAVLSAGGDTLTALLHRSWSVPDRASRTANALAAAADADRTAPYRLRSAAYTRAAELTTDGPVRAHRYTLAAEQALTAGRPHRALRLLGEARGCAAPAAVHGRAELVRGMAELRDGPVADAYETLLLAASLLAADAPAQSARATLAAADAAWAAGDMAACHGALASGTRVPDDARDAIGTEGGPYGEPADRRPDAGTGIGSTRAGEPTGSNGGQPAGPGVGETARAAIRETTGSSGGQPAGPAVGETARAAIRETTGSNGGQSAGPAVGETARAAIRETAGTGVGRIAAGVRVGEAGTGVREAVEAGVGESAGTAAGDIGRTVAGGVARPGLGATAGTSNREAAGIGNHPTPRTVGGGTPEPVGPGDPAALPASTELQPALAAGRDLLADHRTGMRAVLEGRFDRAVLPLRRVADGARAHDGPDVLMRSAAAALLLGDVAVACRAGARALAAARNQGSGALAARALEYLAYAELRAGRHPQGRGHAEEGLRAAHAAGQRNTAAHHHAVLALAASIEGDTTACDAHVDAALTTARRHGLAQAATLAHWAAARADLGCGRPLDAADRLGPLVLPGPRRGHFAVWMLAVPCFVEAAVLAGRPDEARAVMDDFARWAACGADPHAAAQLARCHALLAAPERADAFYRRALTLHEPAGGDFERARTELSYGKWLRRRRRLREARVRLGSALVGFERCGARVWAGQARGELRANGTAPCTAGPDPLSRLTPQQLRIARRVAEGATNREVALSLAVSTRTVDYHLRNVFALLGVRSRVELARMVDQAEMTRAHP